jgi:hypothetical protein
LVEIFIKIKFGAGELQLLRHLLSVENENELVYHDNIPDLSIPASGIAKSI